MGRLRVDWFMSEPDESIRRVHPRRRGTIDYMRMAGRRSNVHGVVEFDVTEARERLRIHGSETEDKPSFTAFLVFCLARAIEDHGAINAYRDWRGRVHTFNEVDVNVLIETSVDDERIGVPYVVRRAEQRSLESIQDEIRTAKESPATANQSRLVSGALRLPGIIRRQLWRVPQLFPARWKSLAGTVAVTSVGMFGSGGGWAISPTNYTLQLTVGGIGTKPRIVDGEVTQRELLSLTVTFDHDVVDGGAAARFVQRLGELVETAHGLDDH